LGGRSEEKIFLLLRGIERQYLVSELAVRSLYQLSYPVEPQKGLPHDPQTNSLIINSDFTELLNKQYHASQATNGISSILH
jgi:hypothetical protein